MSNLCCIKEGFIYILKKNSTGLTYLSNDMGYDPRYICNCYDIMANLAPYRNYTRLVINRGLTVSEDKNGNLGVRGSGDYYILSYLDSKHMMKNICTSQKYISWPFFNFYRKSKQTFWTKVIRQWF